MASAFKIFSDPVHGFISVPRPFILTLIQQPEVQRLRRIRQLGMGYLVFPGGEHTRFGHALGAMALMQDILSHLAEKGTTITPQEHAAALAAALLHDIGHGPFSHTLEHQLIQEFHHELMSRVLLQQINQRLGGVLDLALEIFDGSYPRPFFHELITSQLDVDRLDYLRRDSFFTGVVEGRVGVQRIIKTMRVFPTAGQADAHLVVEAKGIYAVENFLIARRLMYWQVYLHKSVLAGDQILRAIFQRARDLLGRGRRAALDGGSPALLFFLERKLTRADIQEEDVIRAYVRLDDTDVLFSLKQWMTSTDAILSDLSRRFIQRDFFRVTFLGDEPTTEARAGWRSAVAGWLRGRGIAPDADDDDPLSYYLHVDRSRHAAYEQDASAILILEPNDTLREFSRLSDTDQFSSYTQFVEKPYLCYPKEVVLIT